MLGFFLSVSALAQTRRALVIGLGEQQDNNWCKINGDKDVPLVCEMLRACGYKRQNIRTLINNQATRYNIDQAFKSLSSQCKAKDIVYVHFSGHGQLVTDINGDDNNPLALEESWIPFDAYFQPCANDWGENHLIDDQIYIYLKNIANKIGKDGRMLVAVDACHSGGSTLGSNEDEEVVRGISEDGDTAVFNISRGVYDEFKMGPFSSMVAAYQGSEDWLTIAACGKYQDNQEVRKPDVGSVGKLTYALYYLVKKGHTDKKGVVEFMNKNPGRSPQDPQFSGNVTYLMSDVLK